MSAYKLPLDDNCFEFIIIPFYSPYMMSSFQIAVSSNDSCLSSYRQDWCWLSILWDNKSYTNNDIIIDITGNIIISDHDNIVFRSNISSECNFFLEFLIEGECVGKTQTAKGIGRHSEYVFARADIFDAFARQVSELSCIRIHLTVPPLSNDIMQMSWFALQSEVYGQVARSIHGRRSFDWSPWLIPVEQRGALHFLRGLLFTESDLDAVRSKTRSPTWKEHFTLLEKEAALFFTKNPEDRFGAYLPTSDDRYSRSYSPGQTSYHWEALVLGFVGLVNNNQAYIEHALRYLMCMAHTMHWRFSGYERSASDPWSSRAFLEEMTSTSIAILYDWFYYALTPSAIELIRCALWTRGIAFVRYDLLYFDYMHRMNQGIVFNRACILAGLMLEVHLPRVRPYVDLAYDEMLSIVENYIRPDGSISEGVGYYSQMATGLIWAVIAWSRARGKSWENILKKIFRNTERYAHAMASITGPGKVIPYGDCRLEDWSGDIVPILARLFPRSLFADFLRTSLDLGNVYKLTGTLSKSGGIIGMIYGPGEARESRQKLPTISKLDNGGKVSILYTKNDSSVHLWLSGTEVNAMHSHLDVGSFILEVNEERIFEDPGMIEYNNSAVDLMRLTSAHNCITPIIDNTFIEQSIPTKNALPYVRRFLNTYTLGIECSDVWSGYFSYYKRIIKIDSEKFFSIQDTIKCTIPLHIAFHLHSTLKPILDNGIISFSTGKMCISVETPWSFDICIEKSNLYFKQSEIYHVLIQSNQGNVHNLNTNISIKKL